MDEWHDHEEYGIKDIDPKSIKNSINLTQLVINNVVMNMDAQGCQRNSTE